jgi:ribosomal protein S18 acetylase RimI-like enzyme
VQNVSRSIVIFSGKKPTSRNKKITAKLLKNGETNLFDPKTQAHLIPSFVHVHMACILSPPYTIATFLPPLQDDKMTSRWQDRSKEVENGERHIVMQMAPNRNTGESEVAGFVMLGKPFAETGPFRGSVDKLLVLPEHWKKGFARALMLKLEEVARAEGRGLLVSNTKARWK